MLKIFKHINAKCVKCHIIKEEMIRIGAIIFCNKCFNEEFKTEAPVILERKKYLEWLHIDRKELNKEI